MNKKILARLRIASLTFGALLGFSPLLSWGQEPSNVQMTSTLLPTGTQQIVILDNRRLTLAVYHIDPATGKLLLKSVRHIGFDLNMEEFNPQEPLPSELRKLSPTR